jgi:two-component system, response regulator PdtaR
MTQGSGHDGDANLRGLKVLIVEDEAVVAFDLEYILRDLGCAPVPSVGSVADAFDAIATERPDVVLLDVRLSDGSSAPFATHLEAQGIA